MFTNPTENKEINCVRELVCSHYVLAIELPRNQASILGKMILKSTIEGMLK